MSQDIEPKVRYLEMIQGIISRMQSSSFSLKGWTVTLLAGILVLSAKDSNKMFFAIAYIPVIIFWFLDSYYLQAERKYRKLYQIASSQDPTRIDFNLNPPKQSWNEKTCFLQSMFSFTELCFYLPTCLITTIIICLVK